MTTDTSVICTAAQAEAYLKSLVRPATRPYPERAREAQQSISALLKRLDNPQHALNIVHIAGSKGKGSTALLLEAILHAAGLRTGTLTSPHLMRLNERFRLCGAPVNDMKFAKIVEHVRPHVTALQRQSDYEPGFVDTATALALLMFQQADVDVAIIETGLGGRLDVTNVVQPKVTCITSIELEHTDKLGDTLSAIACEKAGIIKHAVPVVLGQLPAAARAEIDKRIEHNQAYAIPLGKAFRYQRSAHHEFSQTFHYFSANLSITVSLPLAGVHAVQNAALAIACAEALNRLDLHSLQQAVACGLKQAVLPGRCEIIRHRPWIVLDTAHTVQSALALSHILDEVSIQRRYWILSFSRDKNPLPFCQAVLRAGDHVTLTQADAQRSHAAHQLTTRLRSLRLNIEMDTESRPELAVQNACRLLQPDDALVITGSVYMAGIGRELLLDHDERPTQPSLSPKPV